MQYFDLDSSPRRRFLSLAILVAVVLIACQGPPIPLVAARGATTMVPIGAGGFTTGAFSNQEGRRMGYGTPSNPDYQRGFLELWLSQQGSDPPVLLEELTVRGVARVAPDRASPAGLNLGIANLLPGQVVMIADVPTTAPLGVHDLKV